MGLRRRWRRHGPGDLPGRHGHRRRGCDPGHDRGRPLTVRPVRNGPNVTGEGLDGAVTIGRWIRCSRTPCQPLTRPRNPRSVRGIGDGAVASRFLRTAALTGGGLAAVAGLAACAPAPPAPAGRSARPSARPRAQQPALPRAPRPALPRAPRPGQRSPASARHAARARAAGFGAARHRHHPARLDRARRRGARRRPPLCRQPRARLQGHLSGDAASLKLAEILGVEDDYPALQQKPAFVQVPQLCPHRRPDAAHAEVDDGVKVFELTIDEIDHRSTSCCRPSRLSATTSQWPGPTIRVEPGRQGPRRSSPTTSKETTGVHFHGVEFDDFFQDGVPFVTQ